MLGKKKIKKKKKNSENESCLKLPELHHVSGGGQQVLQTDNQTDDIAEWHVQLLLASSKARLKIVTLATNNFPWLKWRNRFLGISCCGLITPRVFLFYVRPKCQCFPRAHAWFGFNWADCNHDTSARFWPFWTQENGKNCWKAHQCNPSYALKLYHIVNCVRVCFFFKSIPIWFCFSIEQTLFFCGDVLSLSLSMCVCESPKTHRHSKSKCNFCQKQKQKSIVSSEKLGYLQGRRGEIVSEPDLETCLKSRPILQDPRLLSKHCQL